MNTHYEIGPFRFDARTRTLTRADVVEPIGTRAAAVLAVLVEHANEPVLKSAIIDAAWPGLVVEESNLSVQISKIRRVLGKAPEGNRWIETLARRGYRFIGPLKALSTTPSDAVDEDARSNLPRPLTSFIGRDLESRELAAMLRSQRMLTLVGPGGIGKTRLALQVAADLAETYRDGVWFVDLAPITDPELVASAVAQVLQIRESSGKPLVEILCRNLKQRSLLLLLDNCEHVRAASATVAELLLGSAPGLTILATSRESIHVPGEQVYPLQPLQLPEPTADADAISRTDAVRLFVARALQHRPSFELTKGNVTGIAELCIHLDGIPLALEFAAARVPVLSIGEINAHLDDRFRLLAGRTSTALPRQQTLRATFDWSFDLLTERERVVVRRLAIFPNGFTLEAASSVCAVGNSEAFAMLDVLSQLVDRSLVVADTKNAGARYRLLETTRAFALDKLAEAGETAALRKRQAQYMRELFESAALDYLGLPDVRWRELYMPERDNVRAALDWAFSADGETRLGVALAGGSGPLWFELSLQTEGRHWLETAVSRMGEEASAAERALAWLWLALLWGTAAPTRAVEATEQAVALYRSLGDELLLGASLSRLARIWVFMGRFSPAAVAFAEARALLERAALPKPLASCIEGCGFLQMLTGDLAGARTAFERALSLYRSARADSAALGVLVNLGDLTWALGDLDAALQQCREAVRLMRGAPLFAKEMLGTCLTNLAGVLIERGDLDEALQVAREGLPLRQDSGHAWVAMDHFALRAALVGKLENAARIAGHVDATHRAKPSLRQPNEARAYARLMELLRARLDENHITRLLAEGAGIGDDEACRLALES